MINIGDLVLGFLVREFLGVFWVDLIFLILGIRVLILVKGNGKGLGCLDELVVLSKFFWIVLFGGCLFFKILR